MQMLDPRDHKALLGGRLPEIPTIAGDVQCTLILGLLVVLPTAAWMQHVYSCVLSGSWGFLVGGTLFLPAGLVHGAGQWIGLWG